MLNIFCSPLILHVNLGIISLTHNIKEIGYLTHLTQSMPNLKFRVRHLLTLK